MKGVWLLVIIFAHSSLAEIYNTVIQTFQNARSNLTVSDQCTESLLLYVETLNSTDEQWAQRMLDATSKIPVGFIYSYNYGEVGAFAQCLDTESNDGQIKGRYCLGSLSLSTGMTGNSTSELEIYQKHINARERAAEITGIQPRNANTGSFTGPSWAICVPSDCSNEDMQEIMSVLISSAHAFCQTKEDAHPPLSDGAIATIAVFSFFIVLLLVSTACELYYISKGTEPPFELLVAFSVYRNGRKLLKISHNSNDLSCINGVKALSMLWVILAHTFSTYSTAFPIVNYKDIIDWADDLRSMTIVSGTLSVDSFLLVGGLLVAYGFIKAKQNGVKFNIFKFYIHRYLRLTPPLAAAVLASATLIKYMGSGPYWRYIESTFQNPCKTHWWSVLLYVQNYVNVEKLCLGQTWYLSVDMQLYILSPILLFLLWRYPKIGMTLAIACAAACIITSFYVAYDDEMPALLTNFNAIPSLSDFMFDYYLLTHTRAAPWFIGALLGYVLAVIKFKTNEHFRKPRIGKAMLTILWASSIAVMLTCVYGGHSTLRGADYNRWGNAFYIALVRPTWALALAWVIFACVIGYGGPVDWILSLPIYQIFNRFAYSIYLIHLTMYYLIALSSKTGIYFTEFYMVYSFWGILMISSMVSVFWVLAFESPVIVIEKIIFKGRGKISDTVGQQTKDGGSAVP